MEAAARVYFTGKRFTPKRRKFLRSFLDFVNFYVDRPSKFQHNKNDSVPTRTTKETVTCPPSETTGITNQAVSCPASVSVTTCTTSNTTESTNLQAATKTSNKISRDRESNPVTANQVKTKVNKNSVLYRDSIPPQTKTATPPQCNGGDSIPDSRQPTRSD